jgi:hypothetical protein
LAFNYDLPTNDSVVHMKDSTSCKKQKEHNDCLMRVGLEPTRFSGGIVSRVLMGIVGWFDIHPLVLSTRKRRLQVYLKLAP